MGWEARHPYWLAVQASVAQTRCRLYPMVPDAASASYTVKPHALYAPLVAQGVAGHRGGRGTVFGQSASAVSAGLTTQRSYKITIKIVCMERNQVPMPE